MATKKHDGWTGPGALLVAALTLGACDAGFGTSAPGPERSAPPGAELRTDDRLSYLLAPCAENGHYDVNTADVPAMLAYALEHGQRDALRRSKQELSDLGTAGLEIARRIMRNHWNLPDERAHVRNAIDVALLSRLPLARDILLEALQHPMEDLRLLALEGLARFEREEDWFALREALNQASSTFLTRAVASMYAVDHRRTADLVLGWVESDELEPYWSEVLPALAAVEDPEQLERCRALWKRLPPAYAISMVAACARAGDADALEALRGWSTNEDATVRAKALVACGQAGLLDQVAQALRSDPSSENRKLAASLLSTPPERIAGARDALLSGCSDVDSEVASMCMRILADRGDEVSIERGFGLLAEEGGAGVRAGLQVLGQSFLERPELAERARLALLAQLEREAHRPLSEQAVLLVALGRLPLRASAEYLLARADASDLQAGQSLQSMRAWRWFVLQAGNVGEASHALLVERFEGETDPLRRIDLLEALTLHGGAAARDLLLEWIAADQLAPYELLYAAERLVVIGPTEAVAPALKRATLRIDQDDVRRGLQCLLWTSYPGPRP